eukprot:6193843-Pleurochrysis_carterae.AAC.3
MRSHRVNASRSSSKLQDLHLRRRERNAQSLPAARLLEIEVVGDQRCVESTSSSGVNGGLERALGLDAFWLRRLVPKYWDVDPPDAFLTSDGLREAHMVLVDVCV